MLYELRILSGLHRGAILALHEDQLLIGAHQDADVVLVDPGVSESHARLRRQDAGWVLEAIDGLVTSPGLGQPATALSLGSGSFARLGPVWIGIFAESDPWQDVPPELTQAEQQPDQAAAVIQEDARDVDVGDRLEPSFHGEMHNADQTANAPLPVRQRKPQRIYKSLLAIVAVATVAAGGYAYTVQPEQMEDAARQVTPLTRNAAQDPQAIKPAVHIQSSKAEPSQQANPNASSPYATEELKKAFRRRLTDSDLIKRFDMELGDREWTMRGNLDDEETARFERVLKGFITEHHITFPVNAKVVPAEGMLPFKISQLVTGANASIVTEDGDRIYVGDEFKGIRLVSINGNHLTFAGKRKIEIRW